MMAQETIIAVVVAGIIAGFLMGRFARKRGNAPVARTPPIDFQNIDLGVKSFILSGQKIQAIKKYRELYGVDLKAAKDAVDAIEKHLRAHLP